MHPKRAQRLILIVFLLLGVSTVVALSLFVLNENMNYFYSPAKIVAGEAPVGPRIRAGGMVVEGSVVRDPQSLAVSFVLTDYAATVQVRYVGILPDLFREGQGVVAIGKLNPDRVMVAEEVLAKHDETYMPPEVAEALEQAHPASTNTDAATP
jgi:cytochrome c-type biogenesis protein CcmE